MKYLPNDVLLNIWSFVGPRTLYLDKKLLTLINVLRNEFINNPIKIKYKLIRWKRKFHEEYYGRPSMCVEPYKYIEINEKLYIGKVAYNKSLSFSKDIEDKIIPVSYMNLADSPIYKGSVIYWTVKDVICDDSIERLERYCLLWNKY